MKKNNAGMSLLEVVVAVAMLAILAGGLVYGIGQLGGFRAREGADTVATSLAQARVAVLGKAKHSGNMCWEIYLKDNEFWVRTVYDADGTPTYRDDKLLVEGNVEVWVGDCEADGSNYHITKMNQYVNNFRVYFNRSTGAVCDGSGNPETRSQMIRVKQGAKDYDVRVIAQTGKIVSETVAQDKDAE